MNEEVGIQVDGRWIYKKPVPEIVESRNCRSSLPSAEEGDRKDKFDAFFCGVFDTSLEFEYALLYEALLKKRMVSGETYSERDILDYLDDLREMGMRAVFQPEK